MAINASGYLQHLKTYLKSHTSGDENYGKLCKASEARGIAKNEIVLADTDETSKKRFSVKLSFEGDVCAVKLDGCKNPLFHFLDDKNTRRPWQKRCDFVIFHANGNKLDAYCIEFKHARTLIPAEKIMLQLHAGSAWCHTLHKLVDVYAGHKRKINLSKYVFTACENPTPDLDPTGMYLKDYPDIRHYLFSEVDGQNLSFLENSSVTSIR